VKKTTRTKDFKLFKESLREAIKYAQGKPAKVKVEELIIRLPNPGAVDQNEQRAFKNAVLKGIGDVANGKTIPLNEVRSKIGKRKSKLKRPNTQKASLSFSKPTAREKREIRRRYTEMKKGKSVVMHPIK